MNKTTIKINMASIYINGVEITNKSEWDKVVNNFDKLQQENKQLKDGIKELQDMVNDKDLLYKKSLGREVERQELLDKIRKYCKEDSEYWGNDSYINGLNEGYKEAINGVLSIIGGE